MTVLEDLRNETLQAELCEAFRHLVDGLVIDPEFEYEIRDVDVLERDPAYMSDIRYEVVLRVVTNNRAQLLGQVSPFDVGDFRGFYNLLYGGWLTSYLGQAHDIDARFFVSVDAIPDSEDNQGPLDTELSLEAALKAGILTPESPLTNKMLEYDLDRLVLGGGAAIAGPLPGPIQTMERLCDRYEVDTILDAFCGSGAMSRVALERGGTAAYCIDLDCGCARHNLASDGEEVTFLEDNFFECSLPGRSFDIAVLDPYFNLIPDVIESRLDEITDRSDYVLMTAGYVSDGYWIDKVEAKLELASGITTVERFDTARTIQLLGHT